MRTTMPAWNVRPLRNGFYADFDQLFESVFDNHRKPTSELSYDVEENEKFILFSLDLPGLDEKEIKIEVKNSVLSISGDRKSETIDEKSKTIIQRKFGSFLHQIKLPNTINFEKIEADYSQGVLKVLLPKEELEAVKKIEVKAKSGSLLSQIFKNSTLCGEKS